LTCSLRSPACRFGFAKGARPQSAKIDGQKFIQLPPKAQPYKFAACAASHKLALARRWAVILLFRGDSVKYTKNPEKRPISSKTEVLLFRQQKTQFPKNKHFRNRPL